MKKTKIIKTLFLVAFILNIINAQAQAKYIGNLEIIPENPTDLDEIKVICTSGFSTSPCRLDSSAINFSGNEIIINANHKVGFYTSPCTSIDTITIGKLMAGNFSLEYILNKTNINNKGSDTATIEFTVSQATFINQHQEKIEKINVYPNPTTAELKVDLKLFKATILTAKITDLTGKEFIRQAFNIRELETTLRFDNSAIPPGEYLINLYSGEEKIAIKKFIKL